MDTLVCLLPKNSCLPRKKLRFSVQRPKGLKLVKTHANNGVMVDERIQQYNEQMKQKMGWSDSNPYEYQFERGLYFHEVYHNLLCGSQPRSPQEVQQLQTEAGVTAIMNLQQDKDPIYWGINLNDIIQKAQQIGVKFIRTSVRDFDGDSLRRHLPEAATKLQHLLMQDDRVYIHCTAGLGRAPAVCIAWMYWFTDMDLDTAYEYLTSIRPCGPKRDAIRAATYDLMISAETARNGHNGRHHSFEEKPHHAYAHVTHDEKIIIREYLEREYSLNP
eukprot:TRINITY_DN8899_c0_g1_i3.p1 TRINITY_DN8899_c0_g1~~TRINITY_DN8899_c0_g1_i3.p1  ORF type:complete len:274 (-),score=32.90 TRINITY_DN8899_c0_g1_i3:873-1694(-)